MAPEVWEAEGNLGRPRLGPGPLPEAGQGAAARESSSGEGVGEAVGRWDPAAKYKPGLLLGAVIRGCRPELCAQAQPSRGGAPGA